MRRNWLIALLGLLSIWMTGSISAQTQQRRLVLIEEFTNTGCGPCASWSPLLDSAINYRLGDCIAIKYHSGYPYAQDPFYNYDKTAQQGKVDFYHVTGVPATYVDGQELATRTYAFLQQAINWCQEQAPGGTLTVEKQLGSNQLLSTTARFTPYYNIENRRVRLFVAAIEEHVAIDPTQAPNGERDLYYTMRKMISPAEGYDMGATLSEGTTYNFEGEWVMDFLDDIHELGVVAYVQDLDTHEVLQAAYSGPDAEGQDRLALMNVTDTPDLICLPNYYGTVLLRNDGANEVSSATLNVEVNGTLKQYPWTGHLGYLDRDTMTFDGLTNFQLTTGTTPNQVRVWFSDINGGNATSNTRNLTFSNSVQATYAVQLKIYTDKKPEEITWKLYNSAGDVIQQGGPYDGQARKLITEKLELNEDDCYQIEFSDAGGDGIVGANGNGYFQLFQLNEAGKSTRLTQGYYDGATYLLSFNLSNTPKAEPQRLVLFEEFTNTSCDPCAEFSPALDEVISRRLGDMVAITYHYNFPSPQDPFYLASANDVMTRANYYDVTGVPSLRVDGQRVGAWGYEAYLESYVDGASQEKPQADIDARAAFDENGKLTVDVSLQSLSTNSLTAQLFVALVEERIEWDKPAENGERTWNYVLRRLLPDANGQTVELAPTSTVPTTFNFSCTPDNYNNPDELGIVVFLQDDETKNILATSYLPRPTGSNSAAKILEVLNTPDRICRPSFTSKLRVRNTGRTTLTSATLNVRINGSLQQTPWTGRLPYLAIDTIATPLFTEFELTTTSAQSSTPNEVEIWLSDLNGTTEETPHRSLNIANAYAATGSVRLTVMTDNAPDEITWNVLNSAGDVVCHGGPYSDPRKKQVHDLPLTVDDCYTLEFSDKGGDGITGQNGRGYFMLHEVKADGKTRLLIQADYTTATHRVSFSLDNAQPLAVPSVVAQPQPSQPAYDLQGRPALPHSRGIVVKNAKKAIQ